MTKQGIFCKRMKNLISKIWKILPWAARIFLVRLTQEKFTASVIVVVFNENSEVLLLDHWLRVGNTGWSLPGGFIQKDEQPAEAAKREVFEETGLKIFNQKLLIVRTRYKHIEIVFYARSSGEPRIDRREIREAKWFSFDEIPKVLVRSQQDFIELALNLESS